jgi:transmembrane sensor
MHSNDAPSDATPEIDWRYLDRYVVGELSRDETAIVTAWIELDPRRALWLEGLKNPLTRRLRRRERPVDARWNTLRERIARQVAGTTVPERSERVVNPIRWLGKRDGSGLGAGTRVARHYAWGITAAAVVITAVVARITPSEPHVTTTTHTTRAGERAVITLDGGSRITLAPRSMLRVRGREVALNGQAFFDIVPRSNEPFVVRTGSVSTQVLGTSFDVTYDDQSRITRVMVVSGKVMTGAKNRTLLTANMIATATDSTVESRHSTDVPALTEWTHGRLIFRDAPVPEVLAAVGKWYGVTFRLTDTVLASQHLTTTVDVRHSKAGTFDALATSLGVQLRIVGDTITLIPERAGRPARPRRVPQSSLTTPLEVGR